MASAEYMRDRRAKAKTLGLCSICCIRVTRVGKLNCLGCYQAAKIRVYAGRKRARAKARKKAKKRG